MGELLKLGSAESGGEWSGVEELVRNVDCVRMDVGKSVSLRSASDRLGYAVLMQVERSTIEASGLKGTDLKTVSEERVIRIEY